MPPSDAGRAALQALDTARAVKPHKDDHALSAALRSLAVLREHWISERRRAPDALNRTRLDHVNGIISAVMAVQFPMGEVPWAELDKARGWLDGLLGVTAGE